MSEELCYLPAARALELFRKRELSPVDVLRAQIARAEKVEPVVNAFPYTFFDDALERVARPVVRGLGLAVTAIVPAGCPAEAGELGLHAGPVEVRAQRGCGEQQDRALAGAAVRDARGVPGARGGQGPHSRTLARSSRSIPAPAWCC